MAESERNALNARILRFAWITKRSFESPVSTVAKGKQIRLKVPNSEQHDWFSKQLHVDFKQMPNLPSVKHL